MNLQELIEEARKRGIVPGARVTTAYSHMDITVPPTEQWVIGNGGLLTGPLPGGLDSRFLKCDDEWATVLSPAPSEEEGLKEGDAVECGRAMRAAIVELARELDLPVHGTINDSGFPNLVWKGYLAGRVSRPSYDDRERTFYTPEAFIAKMRVTASKPKPIMVGSNEVRFNRGSITVGCTAVDNATVRAIVERLRD